MVPSSAGDASDTLIAAMRSVQRGLVLELGGLMAVFALMEGLRYLPT